jgi:hypothetical protein
MEEPKFTAEQRLERRRMIKQVNDSVATIVGSCRSGDRQFRLGSKNV